MGPGCVMQWCTVKYLLPSGYLCALILSVLLICSMYTAFACVLQKISIRGPNPGTVAHILIDPSDAISFCSISAPLSEPELQR